MAEKKPKRRSALDQTAPARHAALERLEDLATRTEAARVGLTRELGAAEARVVALEADRDGRRERYRKLEAEAAAKLAKEREALRDEQSKAMRVMAEQHRQVAALHDTIMTRLARVKDVIA